MGEWVLRGDRGGGLGEDRVGARFGGAILFVLGGWGEGKGGVKLEILDRL